MVSIGHAKVCYDAEHRSPGRKALDDGNQCFQSPQFNSFARQQGEAPPDQRDSVRRARSPLGKPLLELHPALRLQHSRQYG